MKANLEIHPIQGKILKVLLFQPSAKFGELNSDKISSDHFNFHLKALLEANLLEKKSSHYFLTPKGKEFANRFDTEKIIIERQAKITLGIVPVKKNGKKYYLIHQRLKHPYFGYHGSINGKIRWGEKVLDAAKRELSEESGLIAKKMTLVGVYHKTDYSKSKEILEDKYFFRVRVDKFSGKLLKNLPEGKNLWATREQILKLNPLFPDMVDALNYYDKNEITFAEKDFLADGF